MHDPILLPDGSPYKWFDDTTLIFESEIEQRDYKGIYQIRENDIIELQEELKILEEENLPEIDRTEFSPLNISGYFQIVGKHIKEMRDSVEKLLDYFGFTKPDYFNYDEENNYITHPNGDKIEWTDPITEATDLQKFQIKAIHIEDLRHYIQTIWIERFFITPIGDLVNLSDNYTGQDGEVLVDDKIFVGDKGIWYEDIAMNIDTIRIGGYGGDTDGYANGHIFIYITPNTSNSHKLYVDISGTAYCSTWHSTSPPPGGISFADRRTIFVSGGIFFEDDINRLLKPTSIINMDSDAILSDISACGISCEIVFGSGRSIVYVYGTTVLYPTSSRRIIIITDFNDITENIGSDYITEWGAIFPGETVSGINFYTALGVSGSNGSTGTASMVINVTNIELRNS